MNEAVFLDRDGVINHLPPMVEGDDLSWYITKWEDFEFIDGAIDGMRMIADAGYTVIVVSNQSCVGKNLVVGADIRTIFFNMIRDLTHTITFPKIRCYFCPHTPEDNCACCKPKPGMIYQAAIEHEIDLSQSWMVGDTVTDGMAGFDAGILPSKTIAIGSEGWFLEALCKTKFAPNLLEAAKIITGG